MISNETTDDAWIRTCSDLVETCEALLVELSPEVDESRMAAQARRVIQRARLMLARRPSQGPGGQTMIPDAVIDQAANWIAGQERELAERHAVAPLEKRRPYYFKRAQAILHRQAESGLSKIGMAVFCDPLPEYSRDPMAVVHVHRDAVFGYRPEDGDSPSFVWPPEIAAKLRENT